MSVLLYGALVLATGIERLAELMVSTRHARWSFARGGVESGRGHFPAMVALHTGLLVACVVEVLVADRPFVPWLGWPMLALVLASQGLRWWCIATLGPRWNTRVIVVPGLALVRRGPYRWIPHPNYVAVVVEGIALPLVHTAWVTALAFTVLNAWLLLGFRIPAEERALRLAEASPGHGEGLMPDADVLVVGGGPVGLAAAIEARRAGLGVVVLEPRGDPVDKACGEGLMPGTLAAVRRLGVDPAGWTLSGISYRQDGRVADHRFAAGPGRGVRRTALHAALHAAALDAGATILARRADGVAQDAGGVTAGGVRARWLLACDGLHSRVRREAGLEAPPRPGRARRFGLRRHYRVAPWTDLVEVHWGPRVEAYVTPVAADLVGVALLGPPGMDVDGELATLPELAVRLAGAALDGPVRGAGPLRVATTARTAGRVRLVGDASGYVDALTGEGLRVGLAQARAAVAHLDDPRAYERAWAAATRDYRVLTAGLVAAATSPLRRGVVPAAAHLPAVYGAVVERLAR